jgi:hypothetical protein
MFQFLVKPSSPALRRMRTLVSARTTNLAAAAAVQQAYVLVKANYPSRWREASLEWKAREGKPATSKEAETWQDFKALAGGDPIRGFLTGTTYKSISYKLLGKGRGEIFLKGRWPDFSVEEQRLIVGGKQVASAGPEAEFGEYAIRSTMGRIAMGGYDTGITDEEGIPDIAYGDEAMKWIQDMVSITTLTNSIKTIKGKRIMNPPYTERTKLQGRMWGKAGRISGGDFIDITPGGLKYKKSFEYLVDGKIRLLLYKYKIPGESYKNKLIGTRRNSMFKGGGLKAFQTPPHSTPAMDVLYLRTRSRGGAAAKGMAGPGTMSDVAKVYGTVESFFLNILNKK